MIRQRDRIGGVARGRLPGTYDFRFPSSTRESSTESSMGTMWSPC